MKETKTVLLAAMLTCIAGYSQAQTNSDPSAMPPVESTVNSPTGTSDHNVFHELGQAAKDGLAQLKDVNFKNGLEVSPFGIGHKTSSGKYNLGMGVAVTTPTTNTLSLGFAIAAIQDDVTSAKTGKTVKEWRIWDASLSVQANGKLTLPYLGWQYNTFICTGPATDLGDPKTVYEQSFAGVKKNWDLNGNWYVGVMAAAGHCSKWSGDILYLAGLDAVCRLNGKHFLGLW